MVGCFDFFTKMFTPHSQNEDVLHSIRANHQQNITPMIESNIIEAKLNPMMEKIDYIYKQFDYLIDHHLEEIEKEREKYRILKLEYDTLFKKIHELKNEKEVMEEEVVEVKNEEEVIQNKSEKEVMEEEVIQNKSEEVVEVNSEEVVEVKSEEEVVPVVQEKKKRVYHRKKRS